MTTPHPQRAVSDAAPVPSLNDILGLADNARALDKLGGDYGLDIKTKRADASAIHAMRFLRELRHTCPEILQENESLIVATGKQGDLRGRQLYPQKDVSGTWSHSPFRDPPSPQHYSIRQGPSYDHPEPESTFAGGQFQDEFGNKTTRPGPILPTSLSASKTNVRADAAAASAYYRASPSSDPIAFSSVSSNFSLPPKVPSSSINNAKTARIHSPGATHDRPYNYEFGEQQKSRLGGAGPPTQEYGNWNRPAERQGELEPLPSPTVSNFNTPSSSSSALSPGGTTFEPGESSYSPRSTYPYTATSDSNGPMTQMHPHTLIHTRPVPPTFVPTLQPYQNESGNVRGFERGHGYVREQYEYHRYASGGGGAPMIQQQQQPFPLVAPGADLVPTLAPDARTRAHETPTSSRFYPTAPSSAGRAHPPNQNSQSDVTTSVNENYAYSSHGHTHGRW